MCVNKFIKEWESVYNLLEIEEDPTLVKYIPARKYVKPNCSMSVKRSNRNKLDTQQKKKKTA
jgi:hypothetical protein